MRAEDIPFLKPRRPVMVALTALWIPILLSAVIVFVASSILHMVLPYHRSDYKKLPDEDKVVAVLRSRSEEHTSELQSQSNIVCRLLLEKKKHNQNRRIHPQPVTLPRAEEIS